MSVLRKVSRELTEEDYDSVEAEEHLIELEPTLEARKRNAITKLKESSRELEEAKAKYESSLWHARELGLANTVIARAVGRTEAAVRMFFKRSEK